MGTARERSVRVLFDGEVHVHYGFINVHALADEFDFDWEVGGEYRGQVNGMCGAAIPGLLNLVTGLHTGDVGCTVELHSAEPPLDDVWEDAVEVSFTARKKWMGLHAFDNAYAFKLPKRDYRVRYCARGMDRGDDEDCLVEGGPVDFYLLQFWPGPPGPDRILRQTSKCAAGWHRAHPKPVLSPEELAEQEERQRHADQQRWGRVPTDRQRAAADRAQPLDSLDVDLIFALAEADAAVQRRVAVWAAERALTIAGLAALVAPALDAVRRGEPVPAPFNNQRYLWELLIYTAPRTTVRLPDFPGRPPITNYPRQDAALPALFATTKRDPLHAALDALGAAARAYGEDSYRGLFAEARAVFPELRI